MVSFVGGPGKEGIQIETHNKRRIHIRRERANGVMGSGFVSLTVGSGIEGYNVISQSLNQLPSVNIQTVSPELALIGAVLIVGGTGLLLLGGRIAGRRDILS